MARRWIARVVPLVLAACAGPKIAGGRVVLASEEPQGNVLVRYDRITCVDERGDAVSVPTTAVRVVELAGGQRVLVERRAGFDTLVVDNTFTTGSGQLFQVATKSNDGRPFLRSYRIPPGPGDAMLEVTDAFADVETETGFRAQRTGPAALACRLGGRAPEVSSSAEPPPS